MKRLFFFLLCCYLSAPALAIDKISLDIQQLLSFDKSSTLSATWQLDNLTAYIEKPFTAKQQFVFEIAKIALPKRTISQKQLVEFKLKIICKQLQFSIEQIECESGRFQLVSLKKSDIKISANLSLIYNLSSQQLNLKLKPLQLSKANGELSLKYQNNIWHVYSRLNNLDIKQIKKWMSFLQINSQENSHLLDKLSGRFDYTVQISGNNNGWYFINLHTHVKKINMELQQPSQPEILTENLDFKLDLIASKQKQQKQGKSKYKFTLNVEKPTGAVFVDPYYIELTGNEKVTAKGNTDLNSYLDLKQLALLIRESSDKTAKDYISLQGNILYRFDQEKFSNYKLNIKADNLQQLQKKYLDNLLAGTELEGLKLSGKSNIQLTNQKAITVLNADLQQCDISFVNQAIKNLNAQLFWSDQPLPEKNLLATKESTISWDKIRYKKLDIGNSQFSFIAKNGQIKASNAILIPIFDGRLVVNNLQLSEIFDDLKIGFDGLLEPVSLVLLSQQFEWPLLNGKLSALIPHTVYTQKQLHLGGKLWFNIFDGSLSFDKVVLTDPISDYSRFNANIKLNNISLSPLTKTFDFGKMEGRIDGQVNDLVLENWQPVSFDMYIGTVENDNSSHLISQRAVDNLSSMGGLPGVLSKSFMSFFENFHYDKLGLGCHLHNGRCKMRGVEQAPQGNAYYIIKGGGIPRIDIMGYESNVDWNTLIERLESVQQSNKEAVVE